MEQNDFLMNLGELYKEVYNIPLNETDTFKEVFDKFHIVMKKWGIKQGVNENGHIVLNSAQWNACWLIYKTKIDFFYSYCNLNYFDENEVTNDIDIATDWWQNLSDDKITDYMREYGVSYMNKKILLKIYQDKYEK